MPAYPSKSPEISDDEFVSAQMTKTASGPLGHYFNGKFYRLPGSIFKSFAANNACRLAEPNAAKKQRLESGPTVAPEKFQTT